MSFTSLEKSNGPITEPCGTPIHIGETLLAEYKLTGHCGCNFELSLNPLNLTDFFTLGGINQCGFCVYAHVKSGWNLKTACPLDPKKHSHISRQPL